MAGRSIDARNSVLLIADEIMRDAFVGRRARIISVFSACEGFNVHVTRLEPSRISDDAVKRRRRAHLPLSPISSARRVLKPGMPTFTGSAVGRIAESTTSLTPDVAQVRLSSAIYAK